MTKKICAYEDKDGFVCNEHANESGLCFWHDPNQDKSGPEIKEKLEQYARSGGQTRGIVLKHADLSQVNLVNHHKKHGFDFSYADLYRAKLDCAHLFNIKLDHASLMKANLTAANINCASLQDCNLLGVRWHECKIENIKLGKELRQQRLAKIATQKKEFDEVFDLYEQAEEIYRDLRKHSEREGLFSLSGDLIQRELTVRRMRMPKFSFKRLGSKIVDIFCGYGEAPLRIVFISIVMIIICASIYTFTGLNYQGDIIAYSPDKPFWENVSLFLSCLYYSVVTFTTLGYGDFTPVGYSRAIAAIEAFTGSFTIALFVVVFVKKMTR